MIPTFFRNYNDSLLQKITQGSEGTRIRHPRSGRAFVSRLLLCQAATKRFYKPFLKVGFQVTYTEC